MGFSRMQGPLNQNMLIGTTYSESRLHTGCTQEEKEKENRPYIWKIMKNDHRKCKNVNFEKKTYLFLSHVPRITSSTQKIRFLCQKVCWVARIRTDTHESENRGHPFQGFRNFSFNLSLRICPIHPCQNLSLTVLNIVPNYS